VLFTGTSNIELANKIARKISKKLNKKIKVCEPISHFEDGEVGLYIPELLRRKHVVIIQSTSPPKVNDYIMETVFMADAARRASASEISAIIPYFGYSRQDRKDKPRVSICAAVVADMLVEAGCDRILTLDIHAEQEQGFIKQPWDNLYTSYCLIPKILKENIKHLVIASPDAGGVKRAKLYENCLKAEGVAIVLKNRDVNTKDKCEVMSMVGDVKGKNVLIVDDIISTATSIVKARDLFIANGAKKVYVAAAHGIFSGEALKKIEGFEKVFVTDTINHREEVKKCSKIKVVSVAPLLAEAIIRIHTGTSISKGLIL
jgi:ribose-phosphate pyrophosphokinase